MFNSFKALLFSHSFLFSSKQQDLFDFLFPRPMSLVLIEHFLLGQKWEVTDILVASPLRPASLRQPLGRTPGLQGTRFDNVHVGKCEVLE